MAANRDFKNVHDFFFASIAVGAVVVQVRAAYLCVNGNPNIRTAIYTRHNYLFFTHIHKRIALLRRLLPQHIRLLHVVLCSSSNLAVNVCYRSMTVSFSQFMLFMPSLSSSHSSSWLDKMRVERQQRYASFALARSKKW